MSPDPSKAFREGLAALGYVEGHNLAVEFRSAQRRTERFPELAAELVRLRVDVIVTFTTPATVAAKEATNTIPIVFHAGQPVAVGLVASLARPGGNLTGVVPNPEGFTGKQLEVLKEMVPRATSMAVLLEPFPLHPQYLRDTEGAADRLGLKLLTLKVSSAQEIDRAFEAAANARVDAMHVYASPLTSREQKRIVALAKSRRLPAMYFTPDWVTAGGLMSYGPNFPDLHRRMAGLVDKILKGARPGDLPVEEPLSYNLAINAKTARELSLTVPPSLLLRADRLIE
jgi:putative ABC transport system substrate-binding protein